MAYLLGIWGCFVAFAASALYRLIVVRQIRRELGSQAGASPAEKTDEKTNFPELLKEHKARFPVSRTRSLCNVLIGVQLLAAGAALALIVAAQFQPHSLFHLIPAAR
jgi:hypothetical protein